MRQNIKTENILNICNKFNKINDKIVLFIKKFIKIIKTVFLIFF